MKTLTGMMSHQSQEEYLDSYRLRYPSRNRAGKGAMLDEICDTLGWERKYAIKALNNQVNLGKSARKRGSKPIHSEAEREVIVAIWKLSEYPCSIRLKETLSLWLGSFKKHHGKLSKDKQSKNPFLQCTDFRPNHCPLSCLEIKPFRPNDRANQSSAEGRRAHSMRPTRCEATRLV